MPDLVIQPPSEKQKLFLYSKKKYVAYGGARGGGKSWAIRTKAVLLALAYPGIRILIVRRTYAELYQNHIKVLQAQLKGIAKYNDGRKEMTFPNGSTIKFGYCDTEKDLLQYQGTEYDIIAIDEATQLLEKMMTYITACIRGVNNFPKRVYYTCNPGGPGHAYIKRVFIDRRFKESENPDDYEFIQALVTDNAALMAADPDYVRTLDSLPAKIRDAWRYGRWDIYEGQFFEEFADRPEHYEDRQWTHVISPFEIPSDWKIYRAFDWGYARPFSCGWYAVDYDGVIYRFLEFYGCTDNPNEGVKWAPPRVFAEIHRIETEHPWLAGREIYGIADPAIWNAERGESINDVAMRHQVFFSPGDHERIPGWMQMHLRMQFDENGYAMFYVFSTCKQFVRTIPLLMYDEHKVEDLDTDGEDHIADECRYMMMSRPLRPATLPEADEWKISPLYTALNIKREDLPRRTRRKTFEIIPQGGNNADNE